MSTISRTKWNIEVLLEGRKRESPQKNRRGKNKTHQQTQLTNHTIGYIVGVKSTYYDYQLSKARLSFVTKF